MMNVFVELDSKENVVKHFIFFTESELQIPDRLRYVRPPREGHRAIVIRNIVPESIPHGAMINENGMVILDIQHIAAKDFIGELAKPFLKDQIDDTPYLPSMDPNRARLLQRKKQL